MILKGLSVGFIESTNRRKLINRLNEHLLLKIACKMEMRIKHEYNFLFPTVRRTDLTLNPIPQRSAMKCQEVP